MSCVRKLLDILAHRKLYYKFLRRRAGSNSQLQEICNTHTAGWCNGSTFGSVPKNGGSNPSPATSLMHGHKG